MMTMPMYVNDGDGDDDDGDDDNDDDDDDDVVDEIQQFLERDSRGASCDILGDSHAKGRGGSINRENTKYRQDNWKTSSRGMRQHLICKHFYWEMLTCISKKCKQQKRKRDIMQRKWGGWSG